jgi:hypothetical protein
MSQLVMLDFVRPRYRASWLSASLLLLGLGAAAWVGLQARTIQGQRSALELRLASLNGRPPSATETAARARAMAGTELAARELSTPWTALLAELERVSQDSQGQVALIGVEPDHTKHTVHIRAESRTLAQAITYVQRLQGSALLRYPMLDGHEVRTDDAEHPVRFELTGEWRDAP